MEEKYIRFDWAIKRLLRQKANFVVLEGFLSTVLNEDVRIDTILESEGNQQTENDKFNRLDMLVKNSRDEFIIIEVQNCRELDYFHRMLYGTSKVITEYIDKGDPYSRIRKVYSINIVYFDLGQGKDYVYHGRTDFRGIHENDILQLSARQKEQFIRESAGDLFPEYYLLRVEDYNKRAVTPLDEWIEFLKTSKIPETATAKGLAEAREHLKVGMMSHKEYLNYKAHYESVRYQRSVLQTGIIEGHQEGLIEGLEKGKEIGKQEGRIEMASELVRNAYRNGMPVEQIQTFTNLNKEQILEILQIPG